MDLIQKAATMGLLTLLAYFIMINIIDYKPAAVSAAGTLKEHTKRSKNGKAGESVTMISNKLDIDANKLFPVEGINLDVGVHSKTILGAPVENGDNNITQLSVFDDQAKGIVPVNHDLFEKTADFGSDVTNINQFYKNNPEIFDRGQGQAYVPDVNQWDTQGKELFNTLSHSPLHAEINPYNFETAPLG